MCLTQAPAKVIPSCHLAESRHMTDREQREIAALVRAAASWFGLENGGDEELARRVGISDRKLTRWKAGDGEPKGLELARLLAESKLPGWAHGRGARPGDLGEIRELLHEVRGLVDKQNGLLDAQSEVLERIEHATHPLTRLAEEAANQGLPSSDPAGASADEETGPSESTATS